MKTIKIICVVIGGFCIGFSYPTTFNLLPFCDYYLFLPLGLILTIFGMSNAFEYLISSLIKLLK